MLRNAAVVAYRQWRGINEADAPTLPIAASQVSTKWDEHGGDEFYKTVVAHQVRKLVGQVHLHVLRVVGLEIPVAHLMKVNQDGHDLAGMQLSSSAALLKTALQQFGFPKAGKCQPKIIDSAE